MKAKSTSRERSGMRHLLLLPIAVALYAVVLHWAYSEILVPTFGYVGYEYHPPSHIAYPIIIWLITVAAAWFLPVHVQSPSALILWLLYTVMLAPSLLLSLYVGSMSEGRALVVSSFLGVVFVAICLGVRRRAPMRRIIDPPSVTSFWVIIGSYSVFFYIYLAFTAGLSLDFVAFDNVYDVRSDYANDLETAGMLGYLVSTQANVINPIIIARGLHTRRHSVLWIGALGQLILYSVTGFKTVLFSLAAILILALIFRGNRHPKGSIFVWGASFLAIFSAFIDAWQDSIIWTSLFARRFLITPGRLSNLYFEYYLDNPPHKLAGSVLGPWVENNYAHGPATTISLWATGSDATSMNANFLANGFAHFHWVGIIGAAAVLIVYLRFLDRASYGLPVAVSALVVVMPAIALSNTAIQTAMLSHGLLVAVVCLAIAPRVGWQVKSKVSTLKLDGSEPKKSIQAETNAY